MDGQCDASSGVPGSVGGVQEGDGTGIFALGQRVGGGVDRDGQGGGGLGVEGAAGGGEIDPGCGGCGNPICEQSCEDIDNDGISDLNDNCPNSCNAQQLDADGDTIGDVCDDTPGCGGCGQDACEPEC